MEEICQFCQAVKWKDATANSCSCNRRVVLAQLHDPPQEFKQLFKDPLFLVKVRFYNSICALMCLGSSLTKEMPQLTSNWKMLQKACTCYVFKEQYFTKQVHCYLMKQEHQALPSCMFSIVIWKHKSIYGFDREIVAKIQHVQSQVNSFIKMFLQAGKYIRNPDVLNIRLVIHEDARVDL